MKFRKDPIEKAKPINLETSINGFYRKWKNIYQKKFRILLNNIQKQITIDDIQQALITGKLPESALEKIKTVIDDFAKKNLPKLTASAAEKVYKDLKKRYPEFELSDIGREQFNEMVADKFSEQLYQTQDKAIKEAVKYTNNNARIDKLPKQDLSEIIKSGSGLHSVSLKSCLNYYAHQIENNNTKAKAKSNTKKLINRKYNKRAQILAQDSVLNNYRETEYQAIGEGISQGIFNGAVKIWSSSEDNRVCPICQELNGQAVNYNDSFRMSDGRTFDGLNGAHSCCRCVIQYVDRELYELGIY